MKFSDLILRNSSAPLKPGIQPLASLEYPHELHLKSSCFSEFLRSHQLPSSAPLIPSPLPRRYRTTTKRHVVFVKDRVRLQFGPQPLFLADAVDDSPIEPLAHLEIYRRIAGKLALPAFRCLCRSLSFVIIRGTYEEFAVIFNIALINATVVRSLKRITMDLLQSPTGVSAAFAFHDPTRSDYYFENDQSSSAVPFKHLGGPQRIFASMEGMRFLYHPAAFAQVNTSMAPLLLKEAARLLGPLEGSRLIDLYCGWGMLGIFLGKECREILGIDWQKSSVQAAIDNSKRNGREFGARFMALPITPQSLMRSLPPPQPALAETIILDPPRNGPVQDVIDYCANRRPVQILHIFCNVDRIPIDCKEWERGGYRITTIVPLDMFPGTPNLEVLVVLQTSSY